ncbi:MAG TPA: DUF1150 family protein [Thermohalobaculum sp.]|nr:DUF1150 family protein [Thermohalobaculum sp.]
MTDNPFTNPKGQPIVYVREIAADELPDDLRGGHARLYALHDAEGNRLAVAPDRRLAFALARRNDLSPVSVH